MKTPLGAALCLCVAAICPAQESTPHGATAKPVVTTIINAQGQTIGTAALSPSAKGVKIVFDIKNLPPGDHPVHFHQSGKCEPPDFKTAGSHFEGGHDHTMPAGDIPNFTLTVNDDHRAHVTTVAPFVTLGDDDNSVFSGGGTAIIIHATSTEVNGGAPPRIACGVITKLN
jgi:superoxide dismutase, Cu-Zn family